MLKGIHYNNSKNYNKKAKRYQNQSHYIKNKPKQNWEKDFDDGGFSDNSEDYAKQNQRRPYHKMNENRYYKNPKRDYDQQRVQQHFKNENYHHHANAKKPLKYRPKYEKQNQNERFDVIQHENYHKQTTFKDLKNQGEKCRQKYSQFRNIELDYNNNSFNNKNGKNNSKRSRNFNNKNYENKVQMNKFANNTNKNKLNNQQSNCTNQNLKGAQISSTDQDRNPSRQDIQGNFDNYYDDGQFMFELYGCRCFIMASDTDRFEISLKQVYERMQFNLNRTEQLAIRLIILDKICSTKQFIKKDVLFEFKKMLNETSRKYETIRYKNRN